MTSCLSSSTMIFPSRSQILMLGPVAVGADDLLSQLIHNDLSLQIPDLDAGAGSGTQPVAVGAEAEGVAHVAAPAYGAVAGAGYATAGLVGHVAGAGYAAASLVGHVAAAH